MISNYYNILGYIHAVHLIGSIIWKQSKPLRTESSISFFLLKEVTNKTLNSST